MRVSTTSCCSTNHHTFGQHLVAKNGTTHSRRMIVSTIPRPSWKDHADWTCRPDRQNSVTGWVDMWLGICTRSCAWNGYLLDSSSPTEPLDACAAPQSPCPRSGRPSFLAKLPLHAWCPPVQRKRKISKLPVTICHACNSTTPDCKGLTSDGQVPAQHASQRQRVTSVIHAYCFRGSRVQLGLLLPARSSMFCRHGLQMRSQAQGNPYSIVFSGSCARSEQESCRLEDAQLQLRI